MRDETLRKIGCAWNILLAASSAVLVSGVIDGSVWSMVLGAFFLGIWAGWLLLGPKL